VPRKALAIVLVLHCALCVARSVAAEAQDASDADSLNSRVLDLYQAGKYQEAIPIARQILAGAQRTLEAWQKERCRPARTNAEIEFPNGGHAEAFLARRSTEL
jgi:hypothetical protein